MKAKLKTVEIMSTMDFEGTLDILLQELSALYHSYTNKGFSNLRFDLKYGYDGDVSDRYRLIGDRLETIEEVKKRASLAKKSKDTRAKLKLEQKASERAEYERLKRKFENN